MGYQRWHKRTVLVVAMLLAGLAPLIAGPIFAASPDTVVIGIAQEPDTLLGQFSGMGVVGEVLPSLIVGIVELDEKFKPRARRAEKVPTLKDGDWKLLPGKKMRVTIRLKRGYTWHDGRPVTALDTAWIYLMLRNPRPLPSCWSRRVDPSMSVDTNVTVPGWQTGHRGSPHGTEGWS